MPFAATWMDLEIIILSKSDRERQILYDITYMQNLKNDTNELIYKTETDPDLENKLMVTKGERWGEAGINIYTQLYIKQIINKDLLYSTGNSTQYSVITYTGKESEKE